jgi:hypothetical protein
MIDLVGSRTSGVKSRRMGEILNRMWTGIVLTASGAWRSSVRPRSRPAFGASEWSSAFARGRQHGWYGWYGSTRSDGMAMTGDDIAARYGREPGRFEHQLHRSDLFTIDALARAAARWPAEAIEVRVGSAATRGPAELGPAEDGHRELATRCLERIDTGGAWVVLKDAQADGEYRPLFAAAFAALRALARERGGPALERAHIFVASPGVVTPMHADDDQGFLLHIRGGKALTLFDMGDRYFSPAIARTRHGAGRQFELPEGWPTRSVTFELQAGEGAHIPWQWPHEASSTGPGHSVSVNMSFETPRTREALRASVTNDWLVARGLRPRAIGRLPASDWVKARLSPVAARSAR